MTQRCFGITLASGVVVLQLDVAQDVLQSLLHLELLPFPPVRPQADGVLGGWWAVRPLPLPLSRRRRLLPLQKREVGEVDSFGGLRGAFGFLLLLEHLLQLGVRQGQAIGALMDVRVHCRGWVRFRELPSVSAGWVVPL